MPRHSLAEDGRVVYGLRRHWKDGTQAVVFHPLDFIARLAALVPRGKRRLIALITDGLVVRLSRGRAEALPWRIPSRSLRRRLRVRLRRTRAYLLERLGLPTAAPLLAPARSPPELEFAG